MCFLIILPKGSIYKVNRISHCIVLIKLEVVVQLFLTIFIFWELIIVLGIYMKILCVLLQLPLHVGADVTFDFLFFNQCCDSNVSCKNI